MHTTTPFSSQAAAELGLIMSNVEAAERRSRAADAAQVRLFADALQLASPARFRHLHQKQPAGVSSPAELAFRSVRAELALATGSSEAAVDRRLSHAYELTTHYANTLEQLAVGEIGLAHTVVIVTAGQIFGTDTTAESTAARRAAYETAVLAHAVIETPARLRPIARRLAAQYVEHTIDERHAEACQQRRVWVADREDGMSDLTAYLPTIEAHAIYDRLTRMSAEIAAIEVLASAGGLAASQTATGQGPSASEPDRDAGTSRHLRQRTRDQIRTDVFSGLLRTSTDIETPVGDRISHGSTDRHDRTNPRAQAEPGRRLSGIQAHVQILVTDHTLFFGQTLLSGQTLFSGQVRAGSGHSAASPAGSSAAPVTAELIGANQIDADTARQLAANAEHWELISHHPCSGEVLKVDRYRPSEHMRRILGARDLHCRFPGCNAPLHRCDLDHTIPAAAGGQTAVTNLASLCRGHHSLKHHGGWSVRQAAQGVLHWESPTGRRYTDRPASTVQFRAAPQRPPRLTLASRSPPRGPTATPF